MVPGGDRKLKEAPPFTPAPYSRRDFFRWAGVFWAGSGGWVAWLVLIMARASFIVRGRHGNASKLNGLCCNGPPSYRITTKTDALPVSWGGILEPKGAMR